MNTGLLSGEYSLAPESCSLLEAEIYEVFRNF